MGVRFNKRMNILPWLKMNVSKSGISLTIGPKGKTLNVNSSGVSVNVSMGKGVGYSKRLFSWKSLSILSILGLGGASAAKTRKGKKTKDTATKKGGTTVPSLDEAIAEAQQDTATPPDNEEKGCSWGCAALGCLALLVILALVAAVVYLLWKQGSLPQPS